MPYWSICSFQSSHKPATSDSQRFFIIKQTKNVNFHVRKDNFK